jgi:hypothetical protein
VNLSPGGLSNTTYYFNSASKGDFDLDVEVYPFRARQRDAGGGTVEAQVKRHPPRETRSKS